LIPITGLLLSVNEQYWTGNRKNLFVSTSYPLRVGSIPVKENIVISLTNFPDEGGKVNCLPCEGIVPV